MLLSTINLSENTARDIAKRRISVGETEFGSSTRFRRVSPSYEFTKLNDRRLAHNGEICVIADNKGFEKIIAKDRYRLDAPIRRESRGTVTTTTSARAVM